MFETIKEMIDHPKGDEANIVVWITFILIVVSISVGVITVLVMGD